MTFLIGRELRRLVVVDNSARLVNPCVELPVADPSQIFPKVTFAQNRLSLVQTVAQLVDKSV